jgi:hypothetical protein
MRFVMTSLFAIGATAAIASAAAFLGACQPALHEADLAAKPQLEVHDSQRTGRLPGDFSPPLLSSAASSAPSACCSGLSAPAQSVPSRSPPRPRYEWQIGVDGGDGRALYAAWSGWLRTQNRSDQNIRTLASALSNAGGGVRTGAAQGAIAAGDIDGLTQALTGANLSNVDVATLGHDIVGIDPLARLDILRGEANSNAGVLIQSLVDLHQADPAAYAAVAQRALVPCSAEAPTTCGWLSNLATLSPSTIGRVVSASATDAIVCGMPRSIDDFRSILTSDGAAPWCATGLSDAQTEGL